MSDFPSKTVSNLYIFYDFSWYFFFSVKLSHLKFLSKLGERETHVKVPKKNPLFQTDILRIILVLHITSEVRQISLTILG